MTCESCEECDNRPDLQVRQARSLDYFLGAHDTSYEIVEAIELLRGSKADKEVVLEALEMVVLSILEVAQAKKRLCYQETFGRCDVMLEIRLQERQRAAKKKADESAVIDKPEV